MKHTGRHMQLSVEEALVLQQISEHGEDDVVGLARGLQMSRRHVAALLTHLRHQGLVRIKSSHGGWWVQISRKGNKLVQALWPELQAAVY